MNESAPPHPDSGIGMHRHFTFRTALPGRTAAEVWARVSSWEGINHELGPWLRMSVPHGVDSIEALLAARHGQAVSWISLFGLIPVERHVLGLKDITPPAGFDECSHNLLMKVWRHKRTINPADSGVIITDECAFRARIAIMAPIISWVYKRVFRHRHARLVHAGAGK